MTIPTSTPGSNIEVDLQATNPRTDFDVSEDYVLEAKKSGIPVSVVENPSSFDQVGGPVTNAYGIYIDVSQEWPQIQGRLRITDSAISRAYIYRRSDGALMGDVGVSGTDGEVFTVDLDTKLTPSESPYNVVVDAEGSSYETLQDGSGNEPYTSSDGNLTIVGGATGSGTNDPVNLHNIDKVGNITGI